jgi:hypothetical protein
MVRPSDVWAKAGTRQKGDPSLEVSLAPSPVSYPLASRLQPIRFERTTRVVSPARTHKEQRTYHLREELVG